MDLQYTKVRDQPVIQMHTSGSKSPLWMVHPTSSSAHELLPLACLVKDRPFYALTAQAQQLGEETPNSIADIADGYSHQVKVTQPAGPYAIMGYGLGSIFAFEIAKRLESNGDEVRFCGILDSPPNIARLLGKLDWTHSAALVAGFQELLDQSEVPIWTERLNGLSKVEIVERLLSNATTQMRESKGLDPEKMLAMINTSYAFGVAAKNYTPEGNVRDIDVFWCTPLRSIGCSRDRWLSDYLQEWRELSNMSIRYHECEGDHAAIIGPTFVHSFKINLDEAMESRGV